MFPAVPVVKLNWFDSNCVVDIALDLKPSVAHALVSCRNAVNSLTTTPCYRLPAHNRWTRPTLFVASVLSNDSRGEATQSLDRYKFRFLLCARIVLASFKAVSPTAGSKK